MYADAFGHPLLQLETGNKTYVVTEGGEVLDGREKMPLEGYHVLELYSDIVWEATERFSSGQVHMPDLGEIENQLLRDHWRPKWMAEKLVDDALDEMNS